MTVLTVLYDDHCALCRRSRDWLAGQPQLVRMDFVAAGSAEARRRFPQLDHASTLREVTVVDDRGLVYSGDGAWIAALWATVRHRRLAIRLAGPTWRPVARAVVQLAAELRELTSGRRGGDYPDRCDGRCG